MKVKIFDAWCFHDRTSSSECCAVTVNMRQVAITLMMMLLLVHSTSGQPYPDCGGNCQRDGEYNMFSIIIT